MLVGRVGEDGERELEAFGFVDGHQLDSARVGRVGGGFAFAQADVTQGLNVGKEVGEADEARAMCSGKKFFHVTDHARTVWAGGNDSTIMGEVKQAFEDGGGGGARGEGVEFFKQR